MRYTRSTPVQVLKGEKDASNPNVKYLKGIVKVAAGRSGLYSMALDYQGYVWTWGLNHWGQLGNGKSHNNYPQDPTDPLETLDYEKTSVQVLIDIGPPKQPLDNIKDIDAGISHSIARDGDGFVWCWGYNKYGQLGNGGTANSSLPVPVLKGEMPSSSQYLENVVDVAVSCGMDTIYTIYGTYEYVGFGASYALDSAGRVWAWGNGHTYIVISGIGSFTIYHYQLGQGDDSGDYYEPQRVHGLEDVIITAISAGNHHVLALDNQRYVWAWGKNYYGQLGDGLTANRGTPLRVKKDETTYLTDIVYIDAGFEHSLAIDKDGQIWVWGRNQYGELGLGAGEGDQPYAKPMPVP
jgi:alpha-tubulin suppressor-like RCC1 family protein